MNSSKPLTKISPSLEFHLDLPDKPVHKLLEGYLLLKVESHIAGVKLLATSGIAGHQYHKSWFTKGKGVLPPSGAIAPKKYTLSTQRLWLPHVKGVEGSFYAIAPFAVKVGQVARGDFGIHYDANVPGSAGCCVLRSQSHWDLFRQWVEDIRAKGIQQIPMLVSYGAAK